MADPGPDSLARVASLIAVGISAISVAISAATFIWTRLNKRREREAAAKAALPSMMMSWNPVIDSEGWYTLKLSLRDISQSVRINQVTVVRPHSAVIATWNGSFRGPSGAMIDPKWEFRAAPNPTHGQDAETAHLHLRTKGDVEEEIEIKLKGRRVHGAMAPFELTIVAQRE
jgi:hypothetical protein